MKKARTKGAASSKKSSARPASRGAKNASAKKSAAQRSAGGRSSAKSAKTRTGRSAAKRGARTPPPRKVPARRADYGAPIDGFFAKQPPHLRAILEALRKIVEELAPDASASIKWGMPFYTLNGAMMCALGGHKSHVNLILAGPPDAFVDPEGRLQGGAKGGRHLSLRSLDELPHKAVREWVRTAVEVARASD